MVDLVSPLATALLLDLVMLWAAIVSTGFFMAFAIVQALLGRAKFELQSIYSIALFAPSAVSWFKRLRSSSGQVSR